MTDNSSFDSEEGEQNADEDVGEDGMTPHASTTWKVLGEIESTSGSGVLGHNTATSGSAYGVEGVTDSTGDGAAGVRGMATSDSGKVWGVEAVTQSRDYPSAAVRARAPMGQFGVYATSASTGIFVDSDRTGVLADSTTSDGAEFTTRDGNNDGVVGVNNPSLSGGSNPSGIGGGVRGKTFATGHEAAGVVGLNQQTSGQTYGVRGVNISKDAGAAGVKGESTASSGTTHGVVGKTDSADGYAILAEGDSKTGGDHEVTGHQSVGKLGAAVERDPSVTQTIDDNTWKQVVFETEVADDRNEYDPSTGTFTCAYPGAYHVSTKLAWAGFVTHDTVVKLQVRVNGTAEMHVTKRTDDDSGDTVNYAPLQLNRTLRNLSAGDTIEVWTYQRNPDGDALEIGTSPNSVYLTIDQLG